MSASGEAEMSDARALAASYVGSVSERVERSRCERESKREGRLKQQTRDDTGVSGLAT